MTEATQYAKTPLEMREAIANGECPICGRKFRHIAVHTNRTHGISAGELKDMAGIPKTHPACDPDLSEQCSERGRERYERDPQLVHRLHSAPKTGKRNFSKAGRAINVEKLKIAREAQHEKMLEEGFTDWSQWMRQIQLSQYNQVVAERNPELIAAILDGRTLAEVAQEYDLCTKTVANALSVAGIDINLRQHRMKNPARRQVALDSMKAGYDRKIGELHDQRLSRWSELGKTWEAVDVLAAECGISSKQMRAWLRKAGEAVPDGRAVSPIRGRFSNTHCKNGHDRATHSRLTKDGRHICRTCETASKKKWLAKRG